MSDRFTRLFVSSDSLYLEGSPVIIEASALLKDNVKDVVLAQIKYRSVSDKRIIGLEVSIIASDNANRSLGEVMPYTYLDLEVSRDQEFGSKNPIELTNRETRSFFPYVTEVVFEDHSIWSNDCCDWEKVKEPIKLRDYLDSNEEVEQYLLEVGRDSVYKPLETNGLWYCTCGALNRKAEDVCHVCKKELFFLEGITKEDISKKTATRLEEKYQEAVSAMNKAATIKEFETAKTLLLNAGWKDSKALAEKCQKEIERILEEERKEKADKEAEKRAIRRKMALSFSAIVIALFAIVTGVFFTVTKIIIPNNHYNSARALMEAGRYEEAIIAFEAMNGYKDSNEQIRACLDEEYSVAIALIDEGDYINAYEKLLALNGYQDSAEKASEIFFQYTIAMASVGDTIFLGNYEQDNNASNGKEDIEWIVLEKQDERILVISKYALDCRMYNSSGTNGTWEVCSLRAWLNGTFLKNAFSTYERTIIETTSVSADRNPQFGTNPGNATSDKVFLLSITEAKKYFTTDELRECAPTAYAINHMDNTSSYKTTSGEATCCWWLRTPGIISEYASYVDGDGMFRYNGIDVDCGNNFVRPAMWIDLNSVFNSK